ncbi:MAG TPA: TPM domain-containing protein [Rhodanobacteraceae bacterium]|nr:TPM domain-containing protein [Rhodanobacteraceae bacterium]
MRWAFVLALWLASLLAPVGVWADDAAKVPLLHAHVTDQTGSLDAVTRQRLEAELVKLEQDKGAQLVVLMVSSTAPQDIAPYSLAVAEANQIGRKGSDDGVLLLVAKNDKRARIEVGYGLEGALPDVTASRIIREYLAPRFRRGDFSGGVSDAVAELDKLIRGETLPPPLDASAAKRAGDLYAAAFVALVIAMFLRGLLGRLGLGRRLPLGAVLTGGALLLLFGVALMGLVGAVVGAVTMLLPAGALRYTGPTGRGGWGSGGGFGGGSWGGGGGFGGGGFSGGGGSFGGGGASGGW